MCLCSFSLHMVFVFSFFMFLGLDSCVLQVSSFWFGYGVKFRVLFIMCCVCHDIHSCRHRCGST